MEEELAVFLVDSANRERKIDSQMKGLGLGCALHLMGNIGEAAGPAVARRAAAGGGQKRSG